MAEGEGGVATSTAFPRPLIIAESANDYNVMNLTTTMSAPSAQALDPSVWMNAQQKIDEDIAYLERQITSLKSTRNTLAPIGRLHSDILQEIFLTACRHSYNFGKKALVISWVSHAWRELAIDTPSLWAYITFTQSDRMKASLLRAKGYALEYRLNATNNSDWNSLLPLCLKTLRWVKELRITSYHTSSSIPRNCPHWRTPAPILFHLELDCVSLPPNLFSGICPSLQIVTLMDCTVDWDTLPPLPTLKELIIRTPRNPLTLRTATRLIHRWKDSIKELTLLYALTDGGDAVPISESGRIQLDQLTEFVVQDLDVNLVVRLLDQVSFSHHNRAVISVDEWPDTIYDAFLSSQNLLTWQIHRLEFGLDQTGLYPLVTVVESPSGKYVELEYLNENDETGVPDWFGYFGELETVLSMRILPPFIDHFIASIQDQDTEICNLLEEGRSQDFSDPDWLEVARPIIAFPNLRDLEFRATVKSGYVLNSLWFLLLQRWLEWRKICGFGLMTLAFDAWIVPQGVKLTQLFEEFTEKLEVRGVISDGSGEEGD